MKRFICLLLVLASLFLVSCGGTVTPTETEEPVATTEQTATEATEPIATEATTGKEEVTEPVIDAVLPTDFDDVYWGERFNGELMNALDEAKPGDVFKDDFVFGNGKDRIAVYIEFADFNDSTEKNHESDKIEIFKYFNSIGVEMYFWNGAPYIIVDREQAENLGAIPGHDSFAVAYIQAPVVAGPTANNVIFQSEKDKADAIYNMKDTCTFYAKLGPSLSVGLELGKYEVKNGVTFSSFIERDEIYIKIVAAYLSRIADYIGIDVGTIDYDFSSTGISSLYLTLTREELDKVIESGSYIGGLFVSGDRGVTPFVADTSSGEQSIDVVLPTDLDDVYWLDEENPEIMEKVRASTEPTVIKDDFVFCDGKDKIAVKIGFFSRGESGQWTAKIYSDILALCLYFDSVGIGNYLWNGTFYIVVDREQAEKLGAVPGFESYVIAYIQAPSMSKKVSMYAPEKQKALEIYKTSETCTFAVQLVPAFAWEVELERYQMKSGKKFESFIERDGVLIKLIAAYLTKVADYLDIDVGKIDYTAYSTVSSVRLTLTEEEFERILETDFYVDYISVYKYATY